MQCREARQRLEARPAGALREAADGALLAHLRECADCREHAEELRLVRLLGSLPVRTPNKGFEKKALRTALERLPGASRRHHAGWALATAASVLLAVMLTLHFNAPAPGQFPAAQPQIVMIEVQPGRTRVVDVMFKSERAIENATIIVELDGNLRLENRPGTRQLEWPTSLKAGANKLSLPVQLFESGTGELIITLQYGQTRQQLKVQVREDQSADITTAQTFI